MFVHLHTHSCFSFLDGGSSVEELVARAASLNMPALALTDHDNLCGAVKFYNAAVKAGIKPIQGAEVTLESGAHLTLLADGPEGYSDLCRLLTRAHLENERRTPGVSPDNLRENSAHLIGLSGCRRGRVPAAILRRDYAQALRAAREYRELFGPGRFFLEMQNTLLPGGGRLNAALAELGRRLGLGSVVTNNVHYAEPDGYQVHDVLTCVRTLTRLTDIHPERPLNAENYLKSADEMAELWREYPEALENTTQLAALCRPALIIGQARFPEYDLPPEESAERMLRELTYAGAVRRYGTVTEQVTARLEHELSIINTLGFAGYFLAVWDIANYARQQNIRFAGRGSACDSAVAYCLGMTEVDSLGRGLLFERFMSLERAQKPDIDIDFDSRHRDRVAEYVYRRYGADRVASVATYNTFRGRSALRDIGKVLGFPEEELGPLAKSLPFYSHADHIRGLMEHLPELRVSPLREERYRLLLDLCEKVAGFPRFLGTHLGGLVISREPIADITPLQMAAKGMVISQFDKDDVEDLGLIKLDLLSLRTLGAVDDTAVMVREHTPDFDYDTISLDDDATYQLLNTGETIGVFQLESPAQRALQARLGAEHMEDIVASVAIIRPGPIQGNMVEPFIRRRQGQEEVTYLHPAMEPILSETYGVILFQEQVIELATAVANFTPGEADSLRRVMSHARSHRAMEEIGQHFVQKALANGVEQEVAAQIFSYIQGYASYGFCEAHAAAFATTAFKTAYLLTHHPAEFYAAILSHQPMGYYPPRIIVNEARRRGIAVLSPDINRSQTHYTVENGAIRVSLTAIKDLSSRSRGEIIAGRLYENPGQLAARIGLAEDEFKALICCGALDGLQTNRRQLMADLPRWLAERNAGSSGLFAEEDGNIKLEDFCEMEKRMQELEYLGFDVRDHIMRSWRPALHRAGIMSSRQLKGLADGTPVKAAGMLFRPHRPPTRSGRITVFLSLEDEFGLTDVTVFEDVYQRCGHLIFAPQTGPLLAEGILRRKGQGVSITARSVKQWMQPADNR